MKDTLQCTIHAIMENVEKLVPQYLEIEEELVKANGNVALCIIDQEGTVYGKIFGQDKIKGRESYKIAWIKASQVWITGYKTGDYEKKVFNQELEEDVLGIRKPDFIGWEGGQPITLADGTILAIGFSGFRGITDLEIVIKAAVNTIPFNDNNQLIENNYQLNKF